MILTDVSDTIHADSLALFALNIEILLADVTKPEKSTILTLTWPVTSSVTSGSNFWPFTGSSRTGLSNGVWNLEIDPVVWEISGGALCPPPPSRTCYYPDPSGARVNTSQFCPPPQKKTALWFVLTVAALAKRHYTPFHDGHFWDSFQYTTVQYLSVFAFPIFPIFPLFQSLASNLSFFIFLYSISATTLARLCHLKWSKNKAMI